MEGNDHGCLQLGELRYASENRQPWPLPYIVSDPRHRGKILGVGIAFMSIAILRRIRRTLSSLMADWVGIWGANSHLTVNE